MSPAVGAADDSWPEDAIEVARVLGAWGLQGGIRLKAFSADPQALFSSKRWHLAAPASMAPRPTAKTTAVFVFPSLLHVLNAREQGEHIVATVQELNDRDAAEALKGARIFVSRGSFPTPEADEFYWVDLIGLAVVNREAQALGVVVDLIETGPSSVLRVHQGAGDELQERLIPFVQAYVDQVDLASRQITVDWGLDY